MKRDLILNLIYTIVFSALAFVVKFYVADSTSILIVLCVASALFAYVRAGLSSVNFDTPNGLSEVHAARGAGKVFTVLFALALFGVAIYAPAAELFSGNVPGETSFSMLTLVNTIFILLTGPAYLIIVASGSKRKRRRKGRQGDKALIKLCAMILTVAPCYHLIVSYRINSANPDIASFAWDIVALASLAIKWVYLLSCCTGKGGGSVKRILLFTSISTVLCSVATAGIETTPFRAVYLFGWASGILTLILILKNLNELEIYKGEPVPVYIPAEESENVDSNENTVD